METVSIPRHAWALVLALGVVLFLADQQAMVQTRNPNFIPSVILLGSAVVPAAFLAFVYSRRLDYDVPVGFVVIAALVAGVVGTAIAGFLEYHALKRIGFLPLVGIGLAEEAAKLAVPVAVLFAFRYRRPSDGLLLGVASGAGFAAFETMGYALMDLVRTQGNVSSLENLLVVRGLMSPAAHMAWTGIAAAALWDAAALRWSRAGIASFLGAFVLAVTLHSLWDGVATLPAYALIGIISLVALGWAIHRATVICARPDAVMFSRQATLSGAGLN